MARNDETQRVALKRAVENGDSLALNELANRAGIQNRKYRWSLPFAATLAATGSDASQTVISLDIPSTGDFLALKLSGLMRSETDAVTDGLEIQMTETGFGKKLFNDFTDTALLVTPGFGTSFYPMIDFEQLFLAKSSIQIDLRNTTNEEITIKGAFHGWLFLGSIRDYISGYSR